jgi:hypothetical protein
MRHYRPLVGRIIILKFDLLDYPYRQYLYKLNKYNNIINMKKNNSIKTSTRGRHVKSRSTFTIKNVLTTLFVVFLALRTLNSNVCISSNRKVLSGVLVTSNFLIYLYFKYRQQQLTPANKKILEKNVTLSMNLLSLIIPTGIYVVTIILIKILCRYKFNIMLSSILLTLLNMILGIWVTLNIALRWIIELEVRTDGMEGLLLSIMLHTLVSQLPREVRGIIAAILDGSQTQGP